jgi:hypothetical protein
VTRRTRRRAGRLGLAVALVLLPQLAPVTSYAGPAAGTAMAPAPATRPSAPVNDDAPAQVLVTKLAPRAPMHPQEFFQVAGTVTNRGSRPLTGLVVRLRRGDVLQSRSQLATADREPPATSHVVGTPVDLPVPELAPGAKTTFDIRLRVGLLGLQSIGVYPLKVEVRGRSGPESFLGPLGSVQTYVPWFPDGPPAGRIRIAWLWPLVDQPRQGPRGGLLDDQLAGSMASGRLSRMLRAAAAGQVGRCDDVAQGPVGATPRPSTQPCRGESVPVTYAVDPDLLFTANTMTSPYSVRQSADNNRLVKDTAPARQWLDTLRTAVSGQDVLALPYADPDVVGLTSRDAGLADDVAQLRQLGIRETSAVTGQTPLTSVVWPPAGRLTRSAVETLTSGGATAAVVDPLALPEPAADRNRTPDTHAGRLVTTGLPVNALVVDQGLSNLLNPRLTDDPGPRLVEQRWLAETAMISAEAPSVSRTLIVAPPRRSDVVASVAAYAMFDSGRLPWMCPVSLAQVAAGTEACLGETAQDTPPAQTAELDPPRPGDPTLSTRFLGEVARLRDDSAQFTDEVLDPNSPEIGVTTSRLLRARARAESSAWWDDASRGQQVLGLLSDDLADLRGKVHLEVSRRPVTLTGATGVISVNVVNELAQPVRVGVKLDARNRARLSTAETPVTTVPANNARQIDLRVTSQTSGKFAVSAQLVDRNKNPFGGEVELVVRSTQYGRVALAVTGVAAGVLLAAVGIRITRRALRRGTAT